MKEPQDTDKYRKLGVLPDEIGMKPILSRNPGEGVLETF
jgi:hypothetical protein